MTIYSKFGGAVTLVRFAKIEDVKTYERRRADKQDKERTADGWRFIAKYEDEPGESPKQFLADVAYLRADDGLKEILDAAFTLPHPDPIPDWVLDRISAVKAVG